MVRIRFFRKSCDINPAVWRICVDRVFYNFWSPSQLGLHYPASFMKCFEVLAYRKDHVTAEDQVIQAN